MTDGGNLATEWHTVLDNLLNWGTNVYILDDRGCGGGDANSYKAPQGATGLFHPEIRTIKGDDCNEEQKNNDPTGQEHWDGGLSGQVGVGTNNSEAFRNEVLGWFDQQCK